MYDDQNIYCDNCNNLIPEYKQLYVKTSAPRIGLRIDIRSEIKKGAKVYCTSCIEKLLKSL